MSWESSPRCGGHRFLIYDDGIYVNGNPHVREGLTWSGFRWALASLEGGNWHPLTWLSHMLDVSLFGMDPGLHHLSSLGYHLAATLLLFLVLREMTGALWRSALAAALFGIHPLHVESVAWVAERKDVLVGLLWMATLGAWLLHLRRPGAWRFLLALAVFFLALAVKPMAVTLPCVLLLLDFWPLGRWPGREVGRQRGSFPWRLIGEKAPLFILAAAAALVALVAQRRSGAVVSLTLFPFPARLANAAMSYVRYLGKTAHPAGLAFFYPYPRGGYPWWQPAAAVLFLGAASLAVLRVARRIPSLATGWLWYLGTLAPVIGLVQVGNQAMADRYTYLPLVGIFILAAWGVPELISARGAGRPVLVLAALAALLMLLPVARRQASVWRDNETLYGHAVRLYPESASALAALGMVVQPGQPDNAAGRHPGTDLLDTGSAVGLYNLGNLAALRGESDRAAAYYAKALTLDPTFAEAYNNLGTVLVGRGELVPAAACFAHAARQRPDYIEAHFNLALVFHQMGKQEEAAREYGIARRLNPAVQEQWPYEGEGTDGP